MRQFFYRINQFRRARGETPSQLGLVKAGEYLSPELFKLFSRMLPFEQAHAIRVMEKLVEAGHDAPDLLAAALLHDVGKGRHSLRPWERGLAVIVQALLPGIFQKWGDGDASGIRAGIVVAANHAAWGAEMAEAAGANSRLVWLIANHDAELAEISSPDVDLLRALQQADSAN